MHIIIDLFVSFLVFFSFFFLHVFILVCRRTGRAGAKGTAISFFTDKHSRMAPELKKLLVDAKQTVPPALDAMCQRGGGGRGNPF